MATETTTMKELIGIYQPGSQHMVGDGFPVRNLFPSNDLDREVSPFLMLDYAGPQYFEPTDHPRGVGEHPHRGFETVTIVYEGVVAHRDSAGNAGVIGPGDVQWMTAASGIVHEEFHEKEFAKKGGTLHAIQLWVNLPRASKMSAPGYQTILNADIPAVDLDGGAGRLRVIAGSFLGHKGPAHTFTPIELYDLQLKQDTACQLGCLSGHNASVFVLQGRASVNGSRGGRGRTDCLQRRTARRSAVEAQEDSRFLVMAGEPIEEPIARYGPFVMNTRSRTGSGCAGLSSGQDGAFVLTRNRMMTGIHGTPRSMIYSDVVCPWCYVGKRRLERALTSVGGDIHVIVAAVPIESDDAERRDGSDSLSEGQVREHGCVRQMEEHVLAAGGGERIPFAFEKIAADAEYLCGPSADLVCRSSRVARTPWSMRSFGGISRRGPISARCQALAHDWQTVAGLARTARTVSRERRRNGRGQGGRSSRPSTRHSRGPLFRRERQHRDLWCAAGGDLCVGYKAGREQS